MNIDILPFFFLSYIVCFFLLLFIIWQRGVLILKQNHTAVIENFGKYSRTFTTPGLYFINPIFDKPHSIVCIKKIFSPDGKIFYEPYHTNLIYIEEQEFKFSSSRNETKEFVTFNANILLFFKIFDPKKAVYNIENLPKAIEKLTRTNLRNIVKLHSMDEIFDNIHNIDEELRVTTEHATEKWGVKITYLEIQDIVVT